MPFDGAKPLKLTGAKAGAGLSGATAQYKFVKMSADNTVVLCASAIDRPIGVLQAPAQTGEAVDVVVVGESMLQVETTSTFGPNAWGYGVGSSANGRASRYESSITAGAQNIYYVAGMVVNVQGGSSSGNLITAVINCVNPPLGGIVAV